MPAAYVIRKATDGQYYFNLTAENNEKILTSETYRDKSGAQNGIQSVRTNSPVDARYQRKTSADGRPYFLLVAANLEVIGRGETYSSSAAMENGIAAVKRNGPGAPVRDEA
jgi:uncharacterized protein YegP (UPF0339 family)